MVVHSLVTTRVRLAGDVIVQDAGDEALLVQLDAENVFALNATGAHIVRAVSGGVRLDDAIATLADEYAGDAEQIAADVRRLVDLLIDRGLLETVEE